MASPTLVAGPKWLSHREFLARDRAAMSEWTRRDGHRHTPYSEYRPELATCTGTLRFDPDDLAASAVAPVLAVCDACKFELAVPRQEADPEHRGRMLLDRSGLPTKFIGKPFEPREDATLARERMRDWLDNVLSAKPPLLYGKPGVGKSHLLASTGELLCHQGVRVMYRDLAALLTAERDYIDRPVGTKPIVLAINVEILILDDLGAERRTPWAMEQLQTLVYERDKGARPILAATNLDPSEWSEAFGERVFSRLAGMSEPTYMGGADLRLQEAM